jgi:hypothetical protein
MATEIQNLGPETMILDFVIHDEITDLGSWFQATVYYAPDGWKESASDSEA